MVEITTIIPTYRRPERLKKAIESVLGQSYPHVRVCVYDNCSGDETEKVVAQFRDPRVHYHCHPGNIGSADNFNFGISKIETSFFSFLSDDDFLLPHFYATALRELEKYPEAHFFVGAVKEMTEEGKIVVVSRPTEMERELLTPPQGVFRLIKNYVNWTGMVFRKELTHSIDKRIEPIDVDFVLKAAARASYIASNIPVAVFVHHSTSYSGSGGLKFIYPSWLFMMENLKKEAKLSAQDMEKAEHLMRLKMRDLLNYIGMRQIMRNNLSELEAICQIVKTLEWNVKTGFIQCAAWISRRNGLLQQLFCRLATWCYRMVKL